MTSIKYWLEDQKELWPVWVIGLVFVLLVGLLVYGMTQHQILTQVVTAKHEQTSVICSKIGSVTVCTPTKSYSITLADGLTLSVTEDQYNSITLNRKHTLRTSGWPNPMWLDKVLE